MNRKKINLLLLVLFVLNITDLHNIWLSIMKFILIALCFILNNRKEV